MWNHFQFRSFLQQERDFSINVINSKPVSSWDVTLWTQLLISGFPANVCLIRKPGIMSTCSNNIMQCQTCLEISHPRCASQNHEILIKMQLDVGSEPTLWMTYETYMTVAMHRTKYSVTLSRLIDRMELEFYFKFDALALQFKSELHI